MSKTIAVLIATHPRPHSLLETAIPSIVAQTRKADIVVIVCDRQPLPQDIVNHLRELLTDIKLVILNNQYAQGAAGSWNTGINFLEKQSPSCFVAILDDDDYWSTNHLALCEALTVQAQLIISGINIVDAEKVIASNVPSSLKSEDFLVGNPGWQGSNTFISLELLIKAGSFSNGLVSCNDRDLAVRVLDLQPLIGFTQKATVFWAINHCDDALSAKRSPQKLLGVSQFYCKYHHRMTSTQKDLFFNRIEQLFFWTRNEIEREIRTKKIEFNTSTPCDSTSTNNT